MLTKNSTNRNSNFHSGFTVLEALITISIVGILSAYAIPAYSDFNQRQVLNTSSSTFKLSIMLARSESAKRHEYVVICPSIDGLSCHKSTKDYSKGWISFVNTDRDYPAKRDNGEELIQVIRFKNNKLKMIANRNAFTFRPSSKRNTNGTMMLCPATSSENNRYYQAIIVSYTGRPRVESNPKSSHLALCR